MMQKKLMIKAKMKYLVHLLQMHQVLKFQKKNLVNRELVEQCFTDDEFDAIMI